MKILTWGICLVVFCLPLYLVRFSIFDIPTTVLELMIYALFVFWLVRANLDANYRRILMRIFKSHKKILIPIILILIGVSLATIFSSDLRVSAGIWKAWLIDPLLFFIVLISVFGSSKCEAFVGKVLYSLFLSGAVVSVISLVYLFLGKLDIQGRLQAFYNSPNYLAMYLAPALVIGAGYYLFTFLGRPSEAASGTPPSLFRPWRKPSPFGLVTRKKIIPCTLILLSFILLSIVLFFTQSYGAWLGIIAAVCFGLLLYLFKLKKTRLALIILCLGLVIVLLLGYLALTQRESSFEARLVIWQKAWQVFRAHPILGIGPGTFGDYFPSYPEWGVPQPHSLFLAFLLQTGIMGFIGFIWLLIWFFRTGFKRCKLLRVNRELLIVMSIMVYILIHGLVDTTYWKNDLSSIFWLIVGLTVVLRIKKLKIQ